MKLSNSQKIVLDFMNEGYELGVSDRYITTMNRVPHAKLQKGGIGKGGPVVHVNMSTFYALQARKLIEPCGDTIWPVRKYQLSAEGTKYAL